MLVVGVYAIAESVVLYWYSRCGAGIAYRLDARGRWATFLGENMGATLYVVPLGLTSMTWYRRLTATWTTCTGSTPTSSMRLPPSK